MANMNPVLDSETGKFVKRTECTPLQLQMISELISGTSKTEACKKLGIQRGTLYNWLDEEYFEKEYRKACEKMYKSTLADAIKGIVDVAKNGAGRDKVKACETLLKLNDYLSTKLDVTANTTNEYIVTILDDEEEE